MPGVTVPTQPDLFGDVEKPLSAVELRECARFGEWDAKTGLPLNSAYRAKLSGKRLTIYEAAYHAEIERIIAKIRNA
jgi:hypothetical protein